jgi:hypothetical protein
MQEMQGVKLRKAGDRQLAPPRPEKLSVREQMVVGINQKLQLKHVQENEKRHRDAPVLSTPEDKL